MGVHTYGAISEFIQYDFDMNYMTFPTKHVVLTNNKYKLRGIGGIEFIKNTFKVVNNLSIVDVI